jgi:ribosomal protein S18 acetylase RimI-like enzyme
MTLTVRPAVDADVEAIRAVGVATWPATYGPLAGPEYVAHGLERWWSTEAVRESIGRGGVFVAELDGAVVGMASVGERDGAPYLWKLYVLPDRHGVGAGSALLDAVIESLPAGSPRLGLDYVDGNERAAAFYRARGFRVTGRTPSPLGVGPDEILMELPLAGRRPQRTP